MHAHIQVDSEVDIEIDADKEPTAAADETVVKSEHER